MLTPDQLSRDMFYQRKRMDTVLKDAEQISAQAKITLHTLEDLRIELDNTIAVMYSLLKKDVSDENNT